MLYYAYVLCIYYYAYACVRNTSQRDIYGTAVNRGILEPCALQAVHVVCSFCRATLTQLKSAHIGAIGCTLGMTGAT